MSRKAKKKELTQAEKLVLLTKEMNKALEKEEHGGTIYMGSDHPKLQRIATGITALDYVMGGGICLERLTQFTGEESAGKTLSAFHAAAAFQRTGGMVMWLNRRGVEDLDTEWAEEQGMDVGKLVIASVGAGDKALATGMAYIDRGLIDLIVCDSIQSFGTTRELAGDIDDESYAGSGAPQMWGRVMRRWSCAMNAGKARTAMIAISQVRAKIGGFSGKGVPDPEGTQIRSLKHWKSVDVYFKKQGMVYEGKADETRRIFSRDFGVHAKKNKTAVPERHASFTYQFIETDDVPKGVDNVATLVRLACAYDLIEVNGAWYEGYGMKAQGEEKFLKVLRSRPKRIRELTTDVLYEAGK